MAGQPVKRAILGELERRAALQHTPEEPYSALQYVHDYIAAGNTMRGLAHDVTKKLGINADGAAVITVWVHGQPDGRAMLAAARALAAHSFAEEVIELVDEADEDKTALLKIKLRAEQRQWLAAKWNRRDYGADVAQVAVNVDFGQLHIDALRSRNFVEAKTQPVLPAAEGADYEVLPAEEPKP